MNRKLMLLLACLFISIGMAMAQTSTVQGVVTSAEDGEPIIGASVLVVGTSLGQVTDVDGKFTISNVPTSAKTLRVSYIGMQSQDMEINRKGVMKIVLHMNAEVLDEVMVVAFGTQKKSSFTGSASVIGSDKLSKKIASNVTTALAGSTPGLQLRGTSGAPGAGNASIKIRGIASMYASTEPLVIVDGAPYSASLSNIPTEDIESVTVLKDAASAALYGARGGAGVIIVTTKKGKTQEAQVNVDMKWGVNSRSVQDYETITDPAKYYETIYQQYYNYSYYEMGKDASAANAYANKTMLDHLQYNIYTVPEGEMLIGQDGLLNPRATLGRSYKYGDETYYLINDNWRDVAYSNSLRQEYNVSINGSLNNKGSYYMSLGYLNDEGVIMNSGFDRVTARVKADYQAKKWLKVGANVGYVNSVTESVPNMSTGGGSSNLMYYTSSIAPIYPIYVRTLDANGNPQIRRDEYGNEQYDYGVAGTNYPGLRRAFMATGNPLSDLRYNKRESKGSQLNGSFFAELNLLDCLKFNATSTINWGHTNYSMFENMYYGAKAAAGGQIDKSQTDSFRQNHTQTVTYFDEFGKNSINVMLGHEYYYTKQTYLYGQGQGLFTPEIPEIDAAGKKMPNSSSYTSEYNVEGYFGNVQYNYDERYFASASYRRDASSRFAKENRWGNFWSVGAAWLINKESFFNASWVDQLKLKISIGQQGNDNIGNFSYIDLYSLTQADGKMAASFAQVGNPDITWETTTNFNVGVEFNLFNNRLNGTIDYYNKKTTDLLFWLSIPESAGSRGYYGNIGDIRNQGVELMLEGSVIRTDDIDWSLQFNISHNNDKILKLPESKIAQLGGFNSGFKWYKEGGHLYNWALPKYAGPDEHGQATYWLDDALEGKTNRPGKNYDRVTTDPNVATLYEQGNCLPDVFGGFGTTLTAYGFDMSLMFDYQIGGKLYDYAYAGLMGNISSANSAGSAIHVDALKAWTPNNTQSNLPRMQYMDQFTTARSDRFLTDASYLNFQSFSVGYTFPKKLLKSLGLSKLRVYASGENLCFWSARKGLDPRYSYSETASMNVYSPVRTIMGGLQVTF